MLDAETKRRIDSCRDMLVGKLPDPKSQVEQITIALIYKFMDDMDAQSEELGGHRTFFAGDFAPYGWAKLMGPQVGGFELIGLYSEAIAKMPENPGVPPLFRDIFKNAYLPYRDPETLRSFLKEINGFTYDHSEKLGDAFEYLLSVLGSQGDAGQFRTPRHIIDFIVDIIAPTKAERTLDPACGTAGFLISSYKHILRAHTKDRPGDLLTADDRTRLVKNLVGYDISPDMVRLSLVNLYLHGFPLPQIEEYDTLTSDDKWNEYADVILANPPFMSPKGGIKPHKRFSVQSNRSEVLFVDYIAEHLTPTGRAGVIVPEGIIFQSGGAYKQLREMLVKNYLVAVVSLPAGVFQPYSGVKTSILIMDKALAKRTDSLLFVKIASDGFGLGAQRRATALNDLPDAARHLKAWMESLRHGTAFDPAGGTNLNVVPKARIAESGEYNLSADRYLSGIAHATEYELVELGNTDIFQVESGGTPLSAEKSYWHGGIPWVTLVDLPPKDFITQITQTERTISEEGLRNSSAKLLPLNTVLVSSRATIGRIGIARIPLATNQGFKNIIIKDASRAIPEFVAYMVKRLVPQMDAIATGGTFKEISKSAFCTLGIPLPPLAVQQEIVAEIEGYQKIIDGARQVVENYKPRIDIRPEWPMVELGEVCNIKSGGTPSRDKEEYWGGTIPWVGSSVCKDGEVIEASEFITQLGLGNSSAKVLQPCTTLIALVGATIGKTALLKFICSTNQNVAGLYPLDTSALCPGYLFFSSQTLYPHFQSLGEGKFRMANLSFVRSLKIPLPPLETQRAIAAEIEAEQRLVDANRELITRFEGKIKAAIDRVWGEG